MVGSGCGFLGKFGSSDGVCVASGVGVSCGIGVTVADPKSIGVTVIVAVGDGTIVGDTGGVRASVASSPGPNIPTKINPTATNGSVILRSIITSLHVAIFSSETSITPRSPGHCRPGYVAAALIDARQFLSDKFSRNTKKYLTRDFELWQYRIFAASGGDVFGEKSNDSQLDTHN